MRFFSNEAKDNVDDQDVRTEAVPQQRPGSPWDDRPGETTGAVHDPAPQPTAFGAGTPGGAVAASAAAGPYDDPDRDTLRSSDAASGVADDRSVAPGDGAREHDDTVAWPAGDGPADRDLDRDAADQDTDRDRDAVDNDADRDRDIADRDIADRDIADHDVDVPLDDRDGDTVDRDDAKVDEAVEGRGTLDDQRVVAGEPADEVIEDRGTFDDPQVVVDEKTEPVPVADRRPEPEPVAVADRQPEPEPVAVVEPEPEPVAVVEPEPVVAVAAVPEPATAATGSASLFPEAETQPLRDRWRDVQLRFVDDPKASTAEAATLVDETIEKLTTSLRQHRGSLASGGDDTEALRVELRAYRDILDRLLGL